MDLPSEDEEVWRYSRISDLDLEAYSPLVPSSDRLAKPAGSGPGLASQVEAVLDAAGPRAGLIVAVNGRLVSVELDPALAARGVALSSLVDAPDGDELLGRVGQSVDFFTELNNAFFGDGALVRVPPQVSLDRPLVVVHWLDAEGAAVFPRMVVQVGERSQVTLLEYAGSPDLAGFFAPMVELDVGEGASAHHLAVQALGPRVWQVGYSASRVGRDAFLHSTAVALGGDYARVRTDSRLVGQGGRSDLLAVYFGDGAQVHDFRTVQDHDAPKTTSDLLFKGAVEDRSRSVYTGLIRVRKGAAGTNAFQTNRNLVLSEGAHADSVPNLEIEENDVRCSHASAVGPIDEEQRFYLESRGIPSAVADRLIVLGFFDDIIERTPVTGLRPWLRRAVAAKLDALPAAASTPTVGAVP